MVFFVQEDCGVTRGELSVALVGEGREEADVSED